MYGGGANGSFFYPQGGYDDGGASGAVAQSSQRAGSAYPPRGGGGQYAGGVGGNPSSQMGLVRRLSTVPNQWGQAQTGPSALGGGATSASSIPGNAVSKMGSFRVGNGYGDFRQLSQGGIGLPTGNGGDNYYQGGTGYSAHAPAPSSDAMGSTQVPASNNLIRSHSFGNQSWYGGHNSFRYANAAPSGNNSAAPNSNSNTLTQTTSFMQSWGSAYGNFQRSNSFAQGSSSMYRTASGFSAPMQSAGQAGGDGSLMQNPSAFGSMYASNQPLSSEGFGTASTDLQVQQLGGGGHYAAHQSSGYYAPHNGATDGGGSSDRQVAFASAPAEGAAGVNINGSVAITGLGATDGVQHKPMGRRSSLHRSNSNLTRVDSQGRTVGRYFTDVKRSTDDAAEDGKDAEKEKQNAQPTLDQNKVKTLLMLEHGDGKEIKVEGNSVTAFKSDGEPTTFDLMEVIGVSPDDVGVISDSIDDLSDAFRSGFNVGLLLADASSPIATPWDWPSWRALRKLVKEAVAKVDESAELNVSITLLNDDQVTDLLADDLEKENLVVAQSYVFGPVVHGVVYETISSADQFNETLDTALRRIEADPDDEDEQGIVLVSAILKQIKSRTSYTEGDEGDVVLSSLFATGVGSGFIHYTRILDKNPAEPRAMFQFALGGPCMTASAITLSSSDGNAHQILTMQQRMGASKNFPLRRGSLRRFVKYSSESMPRTREKIEGLKNPAEKTALTRSLERLELMVDDAEAMLKNPEKELPKTYIRN